MSDKAVPYPPTTMVSTTPDDTLRTTVFDRIWRQLNKPLRIRTAVSEADANAESQALSMSPTGNARRLAARLTASTPPHSLIAFTGLDASDHVGTVALQAALALGDLHAGEIMLVKSGLLQGLRVQGPGDEAHANTIELPDLLELFEVVNHPKLLTLSAWHHLPSADRLSMPLLTVLRSVRKHFRLIIVECPPVLESADAAVLASNCEGVIVVLDNLRHTRSELRDAQAELQRLNAPFLGTVLSSQKTRRRLLPRR